MPTFYSGRGRRAAHGFASALTESGLTTIAPQLVGRPRVPRFFCPPWEVATTSKSLSSAPRRQFQRHACLGLASEIHTPTTTLPSVGHVVDKTFRDEKHLKCNLSCRWEISKDRQLYRSYDP